MTECKDMGKKPKEYPKYGDYNKGDYYEPPQVNLGSKIFLKKSICLRHFILTPTNNESF